MSFYYAGKRKGKDVYFGDVPLWLYMAEAMMGSGEDRFSFAGLQKTMWRISLRYRKDVSGGLKKKLKPRNRCYLRFL